MDQIKIVVVVVVGLVAARVLYRMLRTPAVAGGPARRPTDGLAFCSAGFACIGTAMAAAYALGLLDSGR